jgi:hypothetical protein
MDHYPQTLCRITPQGKRRFLEYLDVLEDVVAAAAKVREATSGARTAGWQGA